MRIGLVITANALLEGDVVWLTASGGLTRDLAEALVFTDRAEAENALAQASARTAEIVGAYLADVRLTADGAVPAHFRETFRTRGPSNYRHGKQSQTGAEPHVSLF
ncbi:MAG: DUF2849 domain-containing protein [Rhodobacteraceae bacterium]|nr:MAG: DUF2849 domain-containing protein [Paracoccaceae bacterium]